MAGRAPKQARSIDSMNRMLEAGEQLFYEGGSAALTLEAVIERAETSTGSFYARFGDMRGFLDQMHDRVLAILTTELQSIVEHSGAQPDLDSALKTFCTELFNVVDAHRSQTYFFAVGNSQDSQWRASGSQFVLGASEAFSRLIRNYLPKPSTAATKRRIDIAGRMIIAAGFQQIMFEPRELSRLNLSQKTVAIELASMVADYLRADSEK